MEFLNRRCQEMLGFCTRSSDSVPHRFEAIVIGRSNCNASTV
jgi:hypothetical protein